MQSHVVRDGLRSGLDLALGQLLRGWHRALSDRLRRGLDALLGDLLTHREQHCQDAGCWHALLCMTCKVEKYPQ